MKQMSTTDHPRVFLNSRMTKTLASVLLSTLPMLSIFPSEISNSAKRKAIKNTVFIQVESPMSSGTGSGFFVSGGIIVTNAHVIGEHGDRSFGEKEITAVINSGYKEREESIGVEVIGVDRESDLAFLRPKERTTKIPYGLRLADTEDIRLTLPVWIFGYPFGRQLTGGVNPPVTIGTGAVSRFERNPEDESQIEKIQIDGELNPGNSGGPIVDRSGRLVAVSVSTVLGTRVSFSIPADKVFRNLEGRLGGVYFTKVRLQEDEIEVGYICDLIDPEENISRLSCRIWTGPGSKDVDREVRRNIDGREFPRHGVDGDGDLKEIISRPDKNRTCRFKIENFEYNKGDHLYIEIHGRRGREEIFFGTKEYSARRLWEIQRSFASVSGGEVQDHESAPRPEGAPDPASKNIWRRWAGPVEYPESQPLDERRIQQTAADDDADRNIPLVSPLIMRAPWILVNHMVTDPSGERLYVANDQSDEVFVLDPSKDYQKWGHLTVEFNPSILWADSKWLLVGSKDSGTLELIDIENYKHKGTHRITRGDDEFYPREIMHIDHEDRLVVIWANSSNVRENPVRWLSRDDGEVVRKKSARELSRFLSLPSGEYVAQELGYDRNKTSVFGKEKLPLLKPETRVAGIRQALTAYGAIEEEESLDFRRKIWKIRYNHDRSALLVPILLRKKPVTVETDLNMVKLNRIYPGVLVETVPAAGVGITFSRDPWPGTTQGEGHEITYRFVDLQSGKTIRMVRIQAAEIAKIIGLPEREIDWDVPLCFVPGREELIIYRKAGTKSCAVLKTGPVPGEGGTLTPLPEPDWKELNAGAGFEGFEGKEAAEDPTSGPSGEGAETETGLPLPTHDEEGAPVRARVGQRLEFTPRRLVMPNMRFSITDPLPGMDIDKRKGTWRWTPGEDQTGTHEIVIEGEMASGGTIRVKRWELEVLE